MNHLIFHTLTGINGLSHLKIKKIDISKVVGLTYHRRSLIILDKEYPYTLAIQYVHTREQTITKRYRTENEVLEELNEIIYKKKLVHNRSRIKSQKKFEDNERTD
jgi:hypothetical protein